MRFYVLSVFFGIPFALSPAAQAQQALTFTQAELATALACAKGRDVGVDALQLCTCKPRSHKRLVWGGGPYSGHSDVCTAARHAGLMTDAGGAVAVIGRAGQSDYEASEANGVTTIRWGSYSNSFDLVPARVGAAQPDAVLACSGFSAAAAPYDCTCPEGSDAGGSVWGSGPYTGDSDICRAAVHAGAISARGGTITVAAAPGQAAYAGSSANGVTTSRWGSYDLSFKVASSQSTVTTLQAGCSTIPSDVDSLICFCAADAPLSKSVWGSGPYTADSDICTAARHAGAIDARGGSVAVIGIVGLDHYTGKSANGVSTSKSERFDRSIVFDQN